MTGTGKIRSSGTGAKPPGGPLKKPPQLGLAHVSKHAKAKQPQPKK